MRRVPRWLAMLPLSLLLHTGVVAAAVTFLRMDAAPPALLLDLEEIMAAGSAGRGGEASPPRAAASRRTAPAATRSAPGPSAVAERREPAAASGLPSPSPSVAATPAPAAPTPENSAPPTSGDEGDVVRAATGSASDATAATSGGGSGSGSGPSIIDGPRGGVGSGVVAALPPGTGGGAGSGLGAVVGSEYGPYLEQIRQRIQHTLRYPASAVRRGVSGTVQLEMSIATDGTISSVSVVTSSAHDSLDRAAVDTARSLPRVPFPRDVRPQPLRVRVPVVFDLR